MFSSTLDTSFLEEKDLLKAKIEKWNKVEQLSFVVELAKMLSTNLIKFMGNIIEDSIERTGSFQENSRLSLNDMENSQFANILEEQANDISKKLLPILFLSNLNSK